MAKKKKKKASKKDVTMSDAVIVSRRWRDDLIAALDESMQVIDVSADRFTVRHAEGATPQRAAVFVGRFKRERVRGIRVPDVRVEASV